MWKLCLDSLLSFGLLGWQLECSFPITTNVYLYLLGITCSVDSIECGVAGVIFIFVMVFFFCFYILLYNLPFYNFIILFTAFV